jgi:hypothetical protein
MQPNGVAVIAAFHMVPYARRTDYVENDDGGEACGLNAITDWRGVRPVTPSVKMPYCLAGHFPEFSALLKQHGPLGQLRRLVRNLENHFPERYCHWIEFYIGRGYRRRWVEQNDQEARVQAAVFYDLAPEVCLRARVLGECPVKIESGYRPRFNLADQLLLRSNMDLKEN